MFFKGILLWRRRKVVVVVVVVGLALELGVSFFLVDILKFFMGSSIYLS
jgi:nicotinamidase-related amidase